MSGLIAWASCQALDADGVGRQVELGLSKEDHQLLSGALDYKDKRVKDVMTPLERVYSFEASVRLNFAIMMEIYRSGVLLRQMLLPGAFWPYPVADGLCSPAAYKCHLIMQILMFRIHANTCLREGPPRHHWHLVHQRPHPCRSRYAPAPLLDCRRLQAYVLCKCVNAWVVRKMTSTDCSYAHGMIQGNAAHTICKGGSSQACTADDELEIRTLVSFHGKANVQYILDITPLNEVMPADLPPCMA